MLLIDTSNSEFNSFNRKRQLTIDLIESFDEFFFQDQLKVIKIFFEYYSFYK